MKRTSINIAGSRLSDNDFTRVMINQQIGRHASFEIRLRQDANRGVLLQRAKSWMGQTVKIGIDDKDDRELMLTPVPDIFIGIVTSLGLARQSGTAELVVRGQSPTVVMDDGPHTRSFTDQGLQEIVDAVIGPHGGAFAQGPKVSPQIFQDALAYCVQYRESNFNFVSRLADRFGEWFYYDGLDLYFGRPSGGKAVPLDFGENGMQYFDLSVRAFPTQFELQAYDYVKHEQLTEAAPLKAKSNDLGNEVRSIAGEAIFTKTPIDHRSPASDADELKDAALRREQVSLDEIVVLNGASSNAELKIGGLVEVSDNLIGEKYGNYIITAITHDIGQAGDYRNSFEAVPEEVTSPPLRSQTPNPFCETQLATISAVDDEDGLGRVKVTFLWQKDTGQTSPWIRVATPYSGKDKGFYLIPEMEDQVLVAFENNDPEKPYVLSGMYNGDAVPEWFDPQNRYKGFKSRGQNEWKFDDKNKSISIHAPSAMTLSAGKTITVRTGGKEDSEINIDVGEGTVNITAKVLNVTAAETIKMVSDKEAIVEAADTVELKSGKELTVEAGQKVETKSLTVKTQGTKNVEVSGTMVDVKGSGPVNVKGMPIKLN
ncbi:MAG: type VI secretion system Vgr family protein [Bacteroidota bacterium]